MNLLLVGAQYQKKKKKEGKYYFKSLNHRPAIVLSFNLSHNDDRLNDQNLSNTLLYRLGKLPGPGESQIVQTENATI